MTKFYLTLCCLLTAFAPAAAQQLTGVVTDNNGEPLFGAVAALKGKTAATTTGVRGEYALQGVDLRRDTLVFTYVGMKKLEVPVAGRTKVDVRLEVMNTAINEVVVIGYGTMRRADLTGAVSSVSSEEIVRTPVNNIAEAIPRANWPACRCSPPTAPPTPRCRCTSAAETPSRRAVRRSTSWTASPFRRSPTSRPRTSSRSTC